MAWRFRRSKKLAPGVRLNISEKSIGLSFGGRGVTYSINSRGTRTRTFSLPGTGLSHVKRIRGRRR